MKRWIMIGLVVMSTALGACGGDDNDKSGGATAVVPDSPAPVGTVAATATTRPPAPRSKDLPDGDPYDFDAPFIVGDFTRQSAQGRTVSTETGGQQAIYQSGDTTIVLTTYRFDDADQAQGAVKFALEASSIIDRVETPYYGPTISFGVALNRHGGYLAAWSHYEWCFLATSNGSLDGLNNFLEWFPY